MARMERLTYKTFSIGDTINKFRGRLDLETVSATEGPTLMETLKIPFTYCWSPGLVPKPLDWHSHIGMRTNQACARF